MAGHIFVSYSLTDAAVVDRIAAKLIEAGYSMWIDRTGIRGGELWRKQIVEAIELADAFIIAISPNSMKSDNVRKELDLAEESKIIIIPVEIQPTIIPPSARYQLVGVQKISLNDFARGVSLLISALGKMGKKSIGEKVILKKIAKFWNQQNIFDRPDGVIYVTTHRLVFLSMLKTLTSQTDVLSFDVNTISDLHETRIMFVSPAIDFYADGRRLVFTFFKNAKEVVEAIEHAKRPKPLC